MLLRWIYMDREKPKDSEETCPSASLSTTWTALGVNPGLLCEKPATHQPSHFTSPSYIVIDI